MSNDFNQIEGQVLSETRNQLRYFMGFKKDNCMKIVLPLKHHGWKNFRIEKELSLDYLKGIVFSPRNASSSARESSLIRTRSYATNRSDPEGTGESEEQK